MIRILFLLFLGIICFCLVCRFLVHHFFHFSPYATSRECSSEIVLLYIFSRFRGMLSSRSATIPAYKHLHARKSMIDLYGSMYFVFVMRPKIINALWHWGCFIPKSYSSFIILLQYSFHMLRHSAKCISCFLACFYMLCSFDLGFCCLYLPRRGYDAIV